MDCQKFADHIELPKISFTTLDYLKCQIVENIRLSKIECAYKFFRQSDFPPKKCHFRQFHVVKISHFIMQSICVAIHIFFVQLQEGFAESVHAFSLIFSNDSSPEKSHMFLGDSQRQVVQWISALKRSRYEFYRERLMTLQIRLMNRTGKDPLLGTGFENNPNFNSKLRTLPDFR